MKRFAAHYLFIYPDLLLQNGIIEHTSGRLTVLPFKEELSHTCWFPGIVALLPESLPISLLQAKIRCCNISCPAIPYDPEITFPIRLYHLYPVPTGDLTFPADARLIPLL